MGLSDRNCDLVVLSGFAYFMAVAWHAGCVHTHHARVWPVTAKQTLTFRASGFERSSEVSVMDPALMCVKEHGSCTGVCQGACPLRSTTHDFCCDYGCAMLWFSKKLHRTMLLSYTVVCRSFTRMWHSAPYRAGAVLQPGTTLPCDPFLDPLCGRLRLHLRAVGA